MCCTLELLCIKRLQTKGSSVLTQSDPSSHSTTIANYSKASPAEVTAAIDAALNAKQSWEMLPFSDRAAVFLKAADLISGKYRYDVMAATIVGQGKNAWQAEIDAAAELCDFLRFNVKYAEEVYAQQPTHNSPGVWNRVEYRPLEGFVYAITPFNFTAIAGNLPCAPALMGNVVVWKPSPFAIASNWLLYSIFMEAGLPPNVIQFVPGDAEEVTKTVLSHKQFSALHYTGSTAVFRSLYGTKIIDDAKNDDGLDLLVGGTYDGSKGYFVNPTIYSATNSSHELFSRELFGPIMVVYVYDDTADPVSAFQDICKTIDSTSEYALTGAVFAKDREALRYAEDALRNCAGNFYLNCKSTGAVVGQQPFGGARASGTNE